jgi:hypothetical protein
MTFFFFKRKKRNSDVCSVHRWISVISSAKKNPTRCFCFVYWNFRNWVAMVCLGTWKEYCEGTVYDFQMNEEISCVVTLVYILFKTMFIVQSKKGLDRTGLWTWVNSVPGLQLNTSNFCHKVGASAIHKSAIYPLTRLSWTAIWLSRKPKDAGSDPQ